MAKRPDTEIIEELRTVECQLSPENLSCDGEAHPDWVRQQGTKLRRRRAELVRELGREPTTTELYGF